MFDCTSSVSYDDILRQCCERPERIKNVCVCGYVCKEMWQSDIFSEYNNWAAFGSEGGHSFNCILCEAPSSFVPVAGEPLTSHASSKEIGMTAAEVAHSSKLQEGKFIYFASCIHTFRDGS